MATTYCTRTPSSNGNLRTFTISFWVKRGKIGADSSQSQQIIGQTVDQYFRIMFKDDNTIRCYDQSGFNFITTKQFSDINSWYHVVLRIDTTQSTQADRARLYVNGVLETAYGTQAYPAQNVELHFNRGELTSIGRSSSSGGYDYLEGYLSEFCFIDGGSLGPDSFGETDTETGQWRLKELAANAFTWGTNGFRILNNGNSVTDSSTNSNNWTAYGSLTNSLDCPSNVFAVWNTLSTVSYKQSSGGNLTFSNGNTTILENGGQYKNAPSTIGNFTGKYYFETKMISPVGSLQYSTYVGVITSGDVQNIGDTYNHVGQTANSVGYNSYSGQVFTSDSATSYGASLANGDILGVALDVTNLKVYFSKNGVWQNSGNPESGATGTGAVSLPSTGDSWLFGGSPTNNSIQSNFGNGYFGTAAVASAGTNASGNGIFEHDVPSGYTALSTKGLNL
mgnify:CR=1 FL=1